MSYKNTKKGIKSLHLSIFNDYLQLMKDFEDLWDDIKY